jgi:uncharacterized protein (DUF983 family)
MAHPSLFRAAFSGLCPRCSERTLFEAPARLALSCSACALDFGALERGGRFAGVLTALLAVVLICAAVGADTWLRPPLWLSLAVWGPVTVASVIGALRLYKTICVYHQFEERSE